MRCTACDFFAEPLPSGADAFTLVRVLHDHDDDAALEILRAIRAAVDLPLIGLYKDGSEGVFITPTARHALEIVAAGADVVAMDATKLRTTLAEDVQAVHEAGGEEYGSATEQREPGK